MPHGAGAAARLKAAVAAVALAASVSLPACGADDTGGRASRGGRPALDKVPGTECSARGLATDLPSATELPDAVANTRQRIVDAAIACDYQALAELTRGGAVPFSYSFGESGDAGDHWRGEEQAGREPLRVLVTLLAGAHSSVAVEGDNQFVWPRAFARDSWDAVPDAERTELRSLYDADDFEGFALAGRYVGYRVGIAADGEWLFFVSGD